MKVRIEFEIPNWTRWLVAGLLAGTVLGYGIAVVRADPVSVKTWNSGELLKAADLSKNFTDLRDAINAQQAAINSLGSPDCPFGYSLDTGTTAIVLCKKGLDEVVKVGSGGAAFWIDRYEASVWSHADGTGLQYGISTAADFPSSFPENGQYTLPLYALSIAQVFPSVNLTWFQAVAACDASGKRLVNRQEWFRAARGTIDPGSSDGFDGRCLTWAGDPGQIRKTGSGTKCRSGSGVEDMIGNVWELTDEWYASLGLRTNGTFAGTYTWPGTQFNSDVTVNIASQARTTDDTEGVGMPGAASRGGSRLDQTSGGIYALDLMSSPDHLQGIKGFRCVIPH